MISLRPAFGAQTTTDVMVQLEVPGQYDAENHWIPGGYGPAFKIRATPLPLGDLEHGTSGKSLKAEPQGERTPAGMRFTSIWHLPINTLVFHGTEMYKIIREGDYHAADFWAAVGMTDTTVLNIEPLAYPLDMTMLQGKNKRVLISQLTRVRYSGSK